MPRKAEITVPAHKTDVLVSELKQIEGLIGLQLHKGASISPPGDIIKLNITTEHLQGLMRKLDAHGLGKEEGLSLSTQDPDSLISSSPSHLIDRDNNEGSWEEMEKIISADSNANHMTLLIMMVSGVLATIGIATNAIHIAIAGMLVAPGFMPIMRISLGIVTKHVVWKRGLIDVIKIYLVLIVASAVTALIMRALGFDPLPGKADYYQVNKTLFYYWTTISRTGIAASAAASLAGAILIATKRSTFTSGVMIGLALVPSAALIGITLMAGDLTAAGNAALRWLLDVGLILVVSFIFFSWKKGTKHKRNLNL